ncbi:MAG: hypothetical protein AAFY72_16645, partial [Cyanobacteria bacterium J06649_4]
MKISLVAQAASPSASLLELLSERLIDFTPILYLSILLVISLYGFHKVLMIWRYYKYRAVPRPVQHAFDRQNLPS